MLATTVESGQQFDDFVASYYQWLLRFVNRKVANRQQAEDLLHDALLDAQVGLEHYRGDAKLSTWVVGVVANKIRRHYRSQAQAPTMVDDKVALTELAGPDGDPCEHMLQMQRVVCLCDCIEALPDPIKRALCQVALDGESYALVAHHLDIPIGTLRSQLSRVREKIREALNVAGVGHDFRT